MPRGAATGRTRIRFLSDASRKWSPEMTCRYQSWTTMTSKARPDHRRHDQHAALRGVAAVEGHDARSGRRYSAVASAKTTTAPRKPL